jgi:hypothetical protein
VLFGSGLLPRPSYAGAPDRRLDETLATSLPEFSSSFGGFATGVDLRSGRTGYGALGEMGVRWLGERSLWERRWIARWDLAVSAQGGVSESVLPDAPLFGGRALLEGELGYRLQAPSAWSALVVVHAAGDIGWLQATSARGAAQSDSNGIEPFSAGGKLRAGFGVSYLDASRSLSLVAFLQEALRPTALSPRGLPFTEGGVELRLDLARSLSLRVDASMGTALSHDAPLSSTDRTDHVELGVGVSKWLTRRLWIGLDATAARDTDRVGYAASHTTYSTSGVPDVTLGISAGFSLGGR